MQPSPPPSLSAGPASSDNKPPASRGDSCTRQPSITRENPEKQQDLTKVLAEAVKCAQALKTDELLTDRVEEVIAELVDKVYPRLPQSLQEQLIVDLRHAREKNTPPVALMNGEQKKNFLGKKGTRTNTIWIIEKLLLSVGICCFVYLMSFYVTE